MRTNPYLDHLNDLLFILRDRERRGVESINATDKTDCMLTQWDDQLSNLMKKYPFGMSSREAGYLAGWDASFAEIDINASRLTRLVLSAPSKEGIPKDTYYIALLFKCRRVVINGVRLSARRGWGQKHYLHHFDESGFKKEI